MKFIKKSFLVFIVSSLMTCVFADEISDIMEEVTKKLEEYEKILKEKQSIIKEIILMK
mgnify:CR=1 FL=1